MTAGHQNMVLIGDILDYSEFRSGVKMCNLGRNALTANKLAVSGSIMTYMFIYLKF
jgi:hypothetical protein